MRGIEHTVRRRPGWHRRKPCHRPSLARARSAGSNRASAPPAPGACRHGSDVCSPVASRTQSTGRRAADRHPGRAAPRHRDRGTRPGARPAHPGRDLPAGEAPSARQHPVGDDGAASRAGSGDDGADTPKPAPGHPGAERRDRPPWHTTARHCDHPYGNLPVLGVRRHSETACYEAIVKTSWVKRKLAVSRPMNSDALLKSSECDGGNALQWHAASVSLPQPAPGIMTVSIWHAPLRCNTADSDRTGHRPDRNRHSAPRFAVVLNR